MDAPLTCSQLISAFSLDTCPELQQNAIPISSDNRRDATLAKLFLTPFANTADHFLTEKGPELASQSGALSLQPMPECDFGLDLSLGKGGFLGFTGGPFKMLSFGANLIFYPRPDLGQHASSFIVEMVMDIGQDEIRRFHQVHFWRAVPVPVPQSVRNGPASVTEETVRCGEPVALNSPTQLRGILDQWWAEDALPRSAALMRSGRKGLSRRPPG